MFSEIEKEYKKGLQQKRFLAYYWPCATLVVILALVFAFIFDSISWIIYGCALVLLLVLVAIFFAWELHYATKTFQSVRRSKSLSAKIAAYIIADDKKRIDNLIADLARNDIRTKENLRLTLDYFQSRLPYIAKTSILSWVLTAVITLSSIVIVAYDDSVGTISLQRLIPIFSSTLAVALIILTPFIIVRIISAAISSSRSKVDATLVEDLAYIYVHFELYRTKLEHGPVSNTELVAQETEKA